MSGSGGMKYAYTVKEISAAQGVSGVFVRRRAKRDGWPSRRREKGRGGGREFFFYGLPDDCKEALRAAEEEARAPRKDIERMALDILRRECPGECTVFDTLPSREELEKLFIESGRDCWDWASHLSYTMVFPPIENIKQGLLDLIASLELEDYCWKFAIIGVLWGVAAEARQKQESSSQK